MDKQIVYLACPYSHPDRDVRVKRFEMVNKIACVLMNQGEIIFSPISHSHPIAEAGSLPLEWAFWRRFDMAYLEVSKKLIVLKFEGWQKSVGVQDEIAIAKNLNLPIEYMEVEDER